MISPFLSEFVQKECLQPFGLNKHHVLAAVCVPDQSDEIQDDGLQVFIRSKWILDAAPPYYMVAIERVEEKKPQIDLVVKIYPDLVDQMEDFSPTQMLEALVNRFGVDVQIGLETSRFFWQTRIPLRNNQDIKLIESSIPATHSSIQRMYLKIDAGPPPIANCALCFALDTTAYITWLRQHKH